MSTPSLVPEQPPPPPEFAKFVCGAACLVIIAAMTSGQVWLSIHATYFIDQWGFIIARSFKRQYILETYVVFFIYLTMAGALAYALELRSPQWAVNKHERKRGSIWALLVFVLAYSQLNYLMKLKLNMV